MKKIDYFPLVSIKLKFYPENFELKNNEVTKSFRLVVKWSDSFSVMSDGARSGMTKHYFWLMSK